MIIGTLTSAQLSETLENETTLVHAMAARSRKSFIELNIECMKVILVFYAVVTTSYALLF